MPAISLVKMLLEHLTDEINPGADGKARTSSAPERLVSSVCFVLNAPRDNAVQ